MRLTLKVICFLAATTLSTSAWAEENAKPPLYNPVPEKKEEKNTGMKSMSWKVPEVKKEEPQETEAQNESAEKPDVTEAEPEKDLTPGQKLWKKYKDLADQEKTADDEEGDDKEEEEEDNSPEAPDEQDDEKPDVKEEKAESDEKTEQKNVLHGILKQYKDSQKQGGKMSSRTFGSLDDEEKEQSPEE